MNDLLLVGDDQGADYWPVMFKQMGDAEETEEVSVEDEEEEETEEERGRKELQLFMFHPDTHPINPMPPSLPLPASGQAEPQTHSTGT